MNNDNLQQLIKYGLAAQQSGSRIAAKSTGDIMDDVTNADLRAALEKDNATAKQWAARIDQAVQEAGGVDDKDNELLETLYKEGKETRDNAKDADSRDLGIIAIGQIALHYWVAAFGTMASYAGAAGLSQTQQAMEASVAEAKQSDEVYTAIAKRILGA